MAPSFWKQRNGAIVLETNVDLPEGASVEVTVVPPCSPVDVDEESAAQSLQQALLSLAGKAEGLPEDASINHDHYLYGVPKR